VLQAEYQNVADEYAKLVKGFYGDRLISICFFGSVARFEATPESDIDVLLIVDGVPRDMGLRTRESVPIQHSLRRTNEYRSLRAQRRCGFISTLILTPEEVKAHPPILLDLTDDAVIAYDKNDFLHGVLDNIRTTLRRLGSKRVRAKKGYYWILKPSLNPSEVIEI
jgi:hypothetical protein